LVSLYEKWIDGTLTQQDVKEWAREQSETKDLSEKELDHVARCLHHLYLWYKENFPVGHFLTNVLRNDFMAACGSADSTNSRVLPIYAKFLYNCAPMDWRSKAKERFEGVS